MMQVQQVTEPPADKVQEKDQQVGHEAFGDPAWVGIACIPRVSLSDRQRSWKEALPVALSGLACRRLSETEGQSLFLWEVPRQSIGGSKDRPSTGNQPVFGR